MEEVNFSASQPAPMEGVNDPVISATIVEDDNPGLLQAPPRKPKTTTRSFVEVPLPSAMNFTQRPESIHRAPVQPEISDKHKSLNAKLLRLKKKNKWESAEQRYSRLKQEKKKM